MSTTRQDLEAAAAGVERYCYTLDAKGTAPTAGEIKHLKMLMDKVTRLQTHHETSEAKSFLK